MFDLLLAAALTASAQGAEPINPRATDFFARDPVLTAWALRRFDLNGDGWLTTFEAQPALQFFKDLADTNNDGRVSVREFQAARTMVAARDNLPLQAPASGR